MGLLVESESWKKTGFQQILITHLQKEVTKEMSVFGAEKIITEKIAEAELTT